MRERKVLFRLICYLKPHRKDLSFALIVLLLATAADVAGPALLKVFIDNYLTPGIFPTIPLLMLGGGYLATVFVSAALHYRQLVSFNQIALKVIQQLRVDVFRKVQYLGLSVFDQTPGGSLVSRMTNDTEAVKELFVSVLSTYVQNIVFLVGTFVAMFALDARLAFFCLVLLPAVFLLMRIYQMISTRIYRALRQELGRINAKLNESIQGMNIIQAMRQEQRFREEFGRINEVYYRNGLANIKVDALLMRPAVAMLYTFALLLILGFFGLQSITGPVQIGVLYAFVNYVDRFFEPLNMIMMRLSQYQQAIIAAERVFELLDDERLAPGLEEGDPVRSFRSGEKRERGFSPGHCAIERGLIEFRNVSFTYDGITEVLKDISFKVDPGQTVALIGHTGSGKSTVANLLLRFYNVTRGEILIDGIPLPEYQDQELRSQIGLVAQEPFMFAGDIRKNILLGRQDISQERMLTAARSVQADQFINKLPGGYAESVSERGSTLSSGQRQLICFARTMAGQPKILVLDEATASVDTETEEYIQAALRNMRQGRSTIVIAHRLSTIQDADRILVLHRGEIVEQGTHSELLANGGLYYKLVQLQRQENII